MLNLKIDYYQRNDDGCCLLCSDESRRENWNGISGKGCLCTECKCKKCIHYREYGWGKSGGYCKIAQDRKKKWNWGKKAEYRLEDLIKDTEKAVFATVRIDGKLRGPQWIPKSTIVKCRGRDKVKNWILRKKGWIEYNGGD